jgi:hypothetical protein
MPVESTPTIRLDDPSPAAPVVPTEITSPTAPAPGPGLTRVVVARGSEVEPLMRQASASVKALADRLESALRYAAASELAVGDASHGEAVEAEWEASLQVIRQEVEERRSRLAAELDDARREAAERVATARAEAMAVVRAAGDELASSLSGGDVSVHAGPTVAEPVGPTGPSDVSEPIELTDASVPPADPAPSPADPAPSDLPPAAASDAPPVPPMPPAGMVAPSGMPPFVAVMIPAADGSGQPSYVLAPTVAAASWPVMSPPPVVTGAVAPAPMASYPNAPAHPAAAPGQVFEPRPRPTARGGLTRMLHVDVILPLVAVAIVIVVLLAWLG